MKHKILLVLLFVCLSLSLSPLSVNIRLYDHPGYTRVVFEGDEGFEYSYNPSKTAIDVRLNRKADTLNQTEIFRNSPLIDRVTHHVEKNTQKNRLNSVFRVQLKTDARVMRSFALEQPFRVVLDLEKSPWKGVNKINDNPQDVKDNPPDPQPPIQPAQEKKRLVINTVCLDPGHGGTDFGAVGRSKITEKEITLKVANKLKKLIESKLGLYVVMTRDKDEEVSLNSRVAKADNQKAQLFVSIHVNSSFRKSASGPETYFVSLKATDQEAFQLSQKENQSSSAGEESETEKIAPEMTDDLKMILWNMAQTEYIKESSVLADYIQAELNILLDTQNRGVKQAPFRVLMRAAMPAVLVEIAFLSNSNEEKKLQNDEFLNNAANSLYNGISKFIAAYNNMNKQP